MARSVKKKTFIKWYIPKLLGIYIPLTIVNIITVAIGYRTASVSLFLFSININLWYVPAVAIWYVLYYFLIKYAERYRHAAIAVVLVIYVICYLQCDTSAFFVEPMIRFRLMYGFVAMILGYDLRAYWLKKEHTSEGIKEGLAAVLFCGGFLITKLLMNRVGIVMRMQFLTQVFGVGFAYFAMQAGYLMEGKIQKLPMAVKKIYGVVSQSSLEIYLVQFAIIGYLKPLMFPLNFVIIIVAVVAAGMIVHWGSELIIDAMCKRVIR